jgi:hypothetical protein
MLFAEYNQNNRIEVRWARHAALMGRRRMHIGFRLKGRNKESTRKVGASIKMGIREMGWSGVE